MRAPDQRSGAASRRPPRGRSGSVFFRTLRCQTLDCAAAEYVCCAGHTALPFPDGAFSAVFCSDAFQYFLSKATSTRELKRLTQDEGIIVLFWVRNGLLEHPYTGLALPPAGYQALVADMPHRLVADSEVLARYLQKQGPPLANSADIESLASEPVLSIVASHRPEALVDYDTFQDWPHAQGRLDLNPLYVKETKNGNGSVSLRRSFPSPQYEDLNQECKSYLPPSVDVNESIWTDLANGKQTRRDRSFGGAVRLAGHSRALWESQCLVVGRAGRLITRLPFYALGIECVNALRGTYPSEAGDR